jgi:hypothetical protein
LLIPLQLPSLHQILSTRARFQLLQIKTQMHLRRQKIHHAKKRISAGVTTSLIHEGSQTASVTETTQDLDTSVLRSKQHAFNDRKEVTGTVYTSLLRSKQQASNEGEEVTEILCTTSAVSKTGDQKDDSNISSHNHEESQEINAVESNCTLGDCKLPASLASSN